MFSVFAKNITKEEREFQIKKNLIENKFYEQMFELGIHNKFNRTYFFDIKEPTEYGYFALLHLENGLSFDKLRENIGVLQEQLKCIWIMETEQFCDYAKVQVVVNPIDIDTPYENPNIEPHQMYLGLNFSRKIIKNDNNDHQMFLIGGAVGSGKTRFIYLVLLSWILSCKVNEVEIYLSDIAKNEYNILENVKHIKSYASTIEELYWITKALERKIEKRKNTISKFRQTGQATNIKEYNEICPKAKMSYCYLVVDEFSVIMPDNSDSKDEKKVKQEILDVIKKISKIGRSLGIFVILATQKTTRDEIPAILKNMSAVRISFRANDSISSEVILGDNSAVGIMKRYAIYSQNGGEKKDYLFSPSITMEKIKELIAPYVDTNRKKVNLKQKLKEEESNNKKQPDAVVTTKSSKKKEEKPSSRKTIDTSKISKDEEGEYIVY